MRGVAVVLALLLLFASCGSDDSDPLVGGWVGTEVGGDSTEWTFAFGTADFSVAAAGEEVYRGTYVAYAGERPARMDSTITESLFPQYVGEVSTSIYRFDGDTLVLAANEPGVADTPTGFVAGGGTRVWELTSQ